MDQVNLQLLFDKLRANIVYADGCFPNEFTTNNKYNFGENRSWTEGFWIGMIWNAYEMTGDDFFYEHAILYTNQMCDRIEQRYRVDHHDLGFLVGLSVIPAYEYTKEVRYYNVIKAAADIMIARFHPNSKFIQAWGEFNSADENRFIVDSLLNIPFLFKATQILNDPIYARIATEHYETVLKFGIRDDFTSHHTVFMNVDSGEFLYGETNQGNSDTSCWSRGQSWIISGIAFNKKFGMEFDQSLFVNLCNVVEKNIPSSDILYWDFDFSDLNPSYLDVASNIIILCGLQEIDFECSNIKTRLWNGVLKSINYQIDHQQMLNNCTYNIPQDKGINCGNIWADYFLIEYLAKENNRTFKGRL